MKPVLYGTLGPSCYGEDVLAAMLDAGMEGIRLNLSHGSLASQGEALDTLAQAAAVTGTAPRIMIDLRGRTTRLGKFAPFAFQMNQLITFSDETVPLPAEAYAGLHQGDTFSVEDGHFVFSVLEAGDREILAQACHEGFLRPGKNVTLPRLGSAILGDADLDDLRLAARWGIHELMLPFAQSEGDPLTLLKAWRDMTPEEPLIFSKIESPEGVTHVQEVAKASHAIVIARGDLGSRYPLPQLPRIQRELAGRCLAVNTPFMVVTEMLASMMEHDRPTRAEVNDIAQAVWSGAGYLMLTGETAAGKHPAEAMRILAQTVTESLA